MTDGIPWTQLIAKQNEMQERINDAYGMMIKLKVSAKLPLPDGTGRYPSALDHHIARLCGYKDGDDMALNFREETDHTFKLLANPDTALVIYKALEARLK